MSSPIGPFTPPAPDSYDLVRRYALPQAIQAEREPPSRRDLTKPFIPFVTPYALGYAIIHRIVSIINLALRLRLNRERLNQPLKHKNFTLLHVAVIAGNLKIAQQLLQARACPDARDVRSWTPLHHAALLDDQPMIQLLLARGATQDLTTNMGGTYQDIWNLTHLASPKPDDPIRLLWQESVKQTQLTQTVFQKLTSAVFIEENNITRDHLWSEWDSPPGIGRLFSFALQITRQYAAFITTPPTHVLRQVTHDSQGAPLLSSPGLGLFAQHPVERGQMVGEYQGNIRQNPAYDHFLLGWNSGLTHRNEIPQINDGFINVVLVPIYNTKGLSKRLAFIAADPIQPGEQF